MKTNDDDHMLIDHHHHEQVTQPHAQLTLLFHTHTHTYTHLLLLALLSIFSVAPNARKCHPYILIE